MKLSSKLKLYLKVIRHFGPRSTAKAFNHMQGEVNRLNIHIHESIAESMALEDQILKLTKVISSQREENDDLIESNNSYHSDLGSAAERISKLHDEIKRLNDYIKELSSWGADKYGYDKPGLDKPDAEVPEK